jgi:hypothetical protein
MSTEFLFVSANILVLPFWGLMILLPNWQGTQRLMNSFVPFVILALLYGFLFTQVPPEVGQLFSSGKLTDLAAAFGDERAAAVGWVHFLCFDLFVGRWIYQEGQRTGVWTFHALALCLFAGPLGLLLHLLTLWVMRTYFPARLRGAAPES